MTTPRYLTLATLFVGAAFFAACGGGGGGASPDDQDTGTDTDLTDIDQLDTADDTLDDDTDAETDTEEDTDTSDGTFGSPCSENAECLSGYCVAGPDGQVCTELCVDECPDPDYSCRLVENSGADLVRICYPAFDHLCLPCGVDSQCGTPDDLCLEQGDGRYCGRDCADGSPCPAGYTCAAENEQCVPVDATCDACLDSDGDGYGDGGSCAGYDCDDDRADTNEDAEELCDGHDNDCDRLIDEDFDFLTDPENCGLCGNDCDTDNASGTCGDGVCSIVSCDEGFDDCDGEWANGCETDVSATGSCGTCTEFPERVGTACGTCGSGSWGCDDADLLVCDGDLGDDALNACDGCGELDGAPGDACGACGLDALVCDGTEVLACDGDTTVNACGGCTELAEPLGDPCSQCDTGTWSCDGAEALVCDGEQDLESCYVLRSARFVWPSGETTSDTHTMSLMPITVGGHAENDTYRISRVRIGR